MGAWMVPGRVAGFGPDRLPARPAEGEHLDLWTPGDLQGREGWVAALAQKDPGPRGPVPGELQIEPARERRLEVTFPAIQGRRLSRQRTRGDRHDHRARQGCSRERYGQLEMLDGEPRE